VKITKDDCVKAQHKDDSQPSWW